MSREAIKSGLFNLIAGLQFDIGGGPQSWISSSTKLKHWDDVDRSLQPAFFLSQGPQTPLPPPAPNGPRAWHYDYTGRVYVNTAGQQDPASVLNPILDAITDAFDPLKIGSPQTLSGLCQWIRLEGPIETFEGTLGDQEVALIQFRALIA
jgi:hypothetical protein